MTKPSSRRTRRGAEAPYRKGDRREAAILDHLERLIESDPLTAISVDDIANGAGISRSTLYFYFASRSEAFAALLSRTLDEFAEPDIESVLDDAPAEVAGGIFEHTLRVWREHGAVLRRAVENLNDPEIARLWQESISGIIATLARWIEHGRASGRAVDTGVEPAEVAEAVCWMLERGFYQLFCREHAKADEERKVATFTTILLNSAGFTTGTSGQVATG